MNRPLPPLSQKRTRILLLLSSYDDALLPGKGEAVRRDPPESRALVHNPVLWSSGSYKQLERRLDALRRHAPKTHRHLLAYCATSPRPPWARQSRALAGLNWLVRTMPAFVRVPQAISQNAGYSAAEAKAYAPLIDRSLDGTVAPARGHFAWERSEPIKPAAAKKQLRRTVSLHGNIERAAPVVAASTTRQTTGRVPFLERFHGGAGRQLSSPVTITQPDGTVDYVAVKGDAELVRQLLVSQLQPGESLETLARPFKRGRRDRWPVAEQERYARLVQLAAFAKERGATLAAIGRELGGRNAEDVRRLLNAKTPDVLGVGGGKSSPPLAPRTSKIKGGDKSSAA